MQSSRVQQVLRDARAMVGTVRPQTPTAPMAPRSLGSSVRLQSLARVTTPPAEPTAGPSLRRPSLDDFSADLSAGSPEAMHRAAAAVFSSGGGATLFDVALGALRERGSLTLMRSEGVLAALIIAARQPAAHTPQRLAAIVELLDQAAGVEELQAYLVTHGLVQTVAEVLPTCVQAPTAGPAVATTLHMLRRLCEAHGRHFLRVGLVEQLVALVATEPLAVRVLCQLAFDDECLAHMRSLPSTVPATVRGLSAVTATADPTTLARALLLLARLVDDDYDSSAALVDDHWDLLIERIFSALQHAHQTAFADGADDLAAAALALFSSLTLIEETGFTLVQSRGHLQCLERTAEEAPTAAIRRFALVCLTNLSFYLHMIDDAATRADAADLLCTAVAGFMFEGDTEAAVEATRALGNISRTAEGRAWIADNSCDDAVVLFLGHEDARLVYNCAGILVNIASSPGARLCTDGEALALLLKHTQRLVTAASTSWEIKDLVAMLLRNIEQSQTTDSPLRQPMPPGAEGD